MTKLSMLVCLAWMAVAATPARASDFASFEYDHIHTVAIVSAIGDVLEMREPGGSTGTPDGSTCHIDISGWGLDDIVTRQIAALVPPRFTVKEAAYDRKAFIQMGPLSATDDVGQKLKALILAMPANNGVDAYVVVHARYMGSNAQGPTIKGLGVLQSSAMMGSGKDTSAYAMYAVDVIDAKTGRRIEYALGQFGGSWLTRSEPMADVDAGLWASTPDAMTPEHKQAIRDVIVPLVSRSLPSALYAAKLIPDVPEPSETAAPSQPVSQ